MKQSNFKSDYNNWIKGYIKNTPIAQRVLYWTSIGISNAFRFCKSEKYGDMLLFADNFALTLASKYADVEAYEFMIKHELTHLSSSRRR